MWAVKRLRVAGVVAALVLTAAACGGGSADPRSGLKPTHTKSGSAKPKPGPHFPQKGHPLKLGQVAQLGVGGKGAAALIKVSKPKVSRTRLSSSYGDNPVHGYFVNFPIKVLNIGKRPLMINRLDFYVKIRGLGKVNTDQGAAPYSGAPEQLDTTELDKGQAVSNFLAFDVSTPHGKFIYGPEGKTSAVWRF
jgi:hypothetical protein